MATWSGGTDSTGAGVRFFGMGQDGAAKAAWTKARQKMRAGRRARRIMPERLAATDGLR